jgi:hypothetical protein
MIKLYLVLLDTVLAAVACFCTGCLQVAIITGCNTGLGKESARVLAARGAGTAGWHPACFPPKHLICCGL